MAVLGVGKVVSCGVFLLDIGGSGLVWIKGDAEVGVEVPTWSCLD